MSRLAAVLAILAGLDIGTSLFGLTHGHPEAAPGMAAVVFWFGPVAVAPVKAWLTILTVALIARVTTRPRWPAQGIALTLFAVPVVHNVMLLRG